jgi:NADH-quinone oxidoreductase subunit K
MSSIPLSWWLIVATALFCLGLYAVLSRKNTIAILMGLELVLNAVNINIAAAEAAVALAIIISAYRQRQTIDVEEFDSMQY